MDDVILKIGNIVYSIAGRDKGRYYIVVKVADSYIWTCDGDLHKVDKFKKKKNKHVKYMDYQSEYIKNKLEDGEKITNSEVRRALKEYVEENQEGSCDNAER